MKILKTIFISLVTVIFISFNLYAFEETGKGTVDLSNYTSFEDDKNIIIEDAKKIACKNALKKYVSTFTIDKKKKLRQDKN